MQEAWDLFPWNENLRKTKANTFSSSLGMSNFKSHFDFFFFDLSCWKQNKNILKRERLARELGCVDPHSLSLKQVRLNHNVLFLILGNEMVFVSLARYFYSLNFALYFWVTVFLWIVNWSIYKIKNILYLSIVLNISLIICEILYLKICCMVERQLLALT